MKVSELTIDAGGAIFDARTTSYPENGYIVKWNTGLENVEFIPENLPRENKVMRCNITIDSYINKNKNLLLSKEHSHTFLVTWMDGQRLHMDIVSHLSTKDEAMKLLNRIPKFDEPVIWDIKEKTEIIIDTLPKVTVPKKSPARMNAVDKLTGADKKFVEATFDRLFYNNCELDLDEINDIYNPPID